MNNICPYKASSSIKSPLFLGEKRVSRILDIFCETPYVNSELSELNLRFVGKADVCILGQTDEGELVCVERQVDIDVVETLDKVYSFAKYTSAAITSLSYRMSDNNELELRLDISLSALLGNLETIRQVASVSSNGEFTSPMGESALVLYYGAKGEKIWDIAKRYNTSMSSIRTENNIDEEELAENKMLLIIKS